MDKKRNVQIMMYSIDKL